MTALFCDDTPCKKLGSVRYRFTVFRLERRSDTVCFLTSCFRPKRTDAQFVEHGSDHPSVHSAGVTLMFFAVRKKSNHAFIFHRIKGSANACAVIQPANNAHFTVSLFFFYFDLHGFALSIML